MRVLQLEGTDPCYNLSVEEYLLRQCSESLLMLWQNHNTVVVGRYQNTQAEINQEFVARHGIRVVRRGTGGGAVYHDLGNLNYSVITGIQGEQSLDFRTHAELIVRALAKLGLDAALSGRNDILVQGRKVSGTAQQIAGGRILHHGTLLLQSNLELLAGALNPSPEKFRSRAAQSVRSRVGNLNDFLPAPISIQRLIQEILAALEQAGGVEPYELTEEAECCIRRLCAEKYTSWDWNYGRSPTSNYSHAARFAGGGVEVRLLIEGGRIGGCKLYGDFLGMRDLAEVEERMTGLPYDYQAVKRCLEAQPLHQYFGAIACGELLSCFFAPGDSMH